MNKILSLLEDNGRLSADELATMLNKEKGDIKKAIDEYEKDKVIVGYKALIDWDKTDREYVTALIELKTVPQRDLGFNAVAKKIANYEEVKSIYLVSGAYDLLLTIEGRTMKEVALFVAEKLAPIEQIQSTATHFVLKKFKDKGSLYDPEEEDGRGLGY